MFNELLGVRRTWAWALALVAVASAPLSSAQSLAPKSQVAAVMVGHSLINYDMPAYLQVLADSKGLTFVKAVQIILGAPLRLNYASCRRTSPTQDVPSVFSFSCDAIDAGSSIGPYDTLILTDANGTISSNRIYNDTDATIANYMDLFLARNPAGRVMLFTTWESTTRYGTSWPDHQAADLALYEEMGRAATAIATSRGHSTKVEIIPVDIAIRDLILQAESGGVPGITSRSQFFLDDVHMNGLGNYFVACVVYAAIYNRSPEGATGLIPNGYPNQPAILDLPVGTAAALQRIAWNTISTYRGGAAALKPKAPTSLQVR